MTKQTSSISKKTLLWSSAAFLTLLSIDKVSADNTHFTDKVIPEATEPTPVEAKAAEFQKVLQDFEVEKVESTTPALTTTENSEPYTQSSETQPIVQPLTSELPFPETVVAEKSESIFQPQDEAKPTIIAETEETVIAPALQAGNEPLPILEKVSSEEVALPHVDEKPLPSLRDFKSVRNERSPLGVLEANRDLNTQQWYLFSSARRGMKSPNDVVEIVHVISETAPSNRGEEVKAILIEKGLKPENIQLISAKGEEGEIGKIYIFAK